ncbi:UNVERIFIED_CONTAM: Cyclin-dependent kinase 10 [Siphonaria sp. JEL0065]|nr:Cyclin-dependent kinase 10 [Siphonaria sp. JEL0065]
MENEADGLPVSALREIALLKTLNHNNIVRVTEVAVGSARDDIFLVMEFCEIDLAALMDNVIVKLSPPRDLKMSNLLLTSKGVLKIADFGLARKFADPPRPMTPRVVTLWYRSPEIILGEKTYTTAADMWSVGCIFGELLKNAPLLPGKIEKSQFDLITTLLGFPTPQIWPTFPTLPLAPLFKPDPVKMNPYSQVRAVLKDASPQAIELVLDLLVYDPKRRVDARGALRHAYFRREGPNPCEPGDVRMKVDVFGGGGRRRDNEGVRAEYLGNTNSNGLRRRLEGEIEDQGRRKVVKRNGGGYRDAEVELEVGAMPFRQFDLTSNTKLKY